ncbi:chromate transporter [Halalkalibacter akibai]|uniref:Chromate transporter n=1 Tax=Halalkalibacter akibai (strain ATCC 43226 / DSM 21942 / CIP 109018 / JCM 9157 / 1139) TaxID=1236973 RepID=W4QY50_HALA3|nr:chromate transporter [Halalkalibacter akibai]GAE37006.1 chromate transporter [Halalkalibacter akibai JCM 9157]
MKTHINLFIAFFRSGILGFGGGPSAIPLVHKEVVTIFKWMNDDEFSDVLALGNTLPGPINTKMAGYIGYRVAGVAGMINAVLSSIVPSILMMIVLLTTLTSFKDQPWVAGMTKGVIPIVVVMMAVLTWDFFKKSNQGLGWKVSVTILLISFLLIEMVHVHPGIIIAILLCYALFKPEKAKNAGNKEKEGAQ